MFTPARYSLPLSISQANNLVRGEHPVGVFRQHRGMTVEELATRSGVPADQIRAMEQGHAAGSVWARERLALALSVSCRDLTREEPRIIH